MAMTNGEQELSNEQLAQFGEDDITYGEQEQRLVQALYGEAAKRDGFVCPVCFERQRTGALLLAHYFRSHHVSRSPGQPQLAELAVCKAALQGPKEDGAEGGGSSATLEVIGSIGSMAGSFAYRTVAGILDVVSWPRSEAQVQTQPPEPPGAGPPLPLEDAPAQPEHSLEAAQMLPAGDGGANAGLGPCASASSVPGALLPIPGVAYSPRAPEAPGEALASTVDLPFTASSRAVLPSESAIWQAVLAGDVRRLEELAVRGALTSGCLQDCNGHSIFWDAVAFHQPEVALWLLQRFPPGLHHGVGVELGELHPRRGDSLLHLTASLPHFTAAAAELFLRLLLGGEAFAPAPLRHKSREGRNFVHAAAYHLNFWILHSVLSSVPDGAVLFTERDNVGLSPLSLLLRRAEASAGTPPPPMPTPSTLAPEVHMPDWWPLPRHLPRGCWGAAGDVAETPPFADVWLEVEDPAAKDNLFRVAANRVILAAGSPVFHKEVKKLPPGEPLRVHPECCRSGEALMIVLRFLYGGDPRSVFAAQPMDLWQLWRLCIRYRLPAPLAMHTRAALLQSLSETRGATMLPVVLEAADEADLAPAEASHLAWKLLSQPDVLEGLSEDGGDGSSPRAKALASALLRVERHVLDALERQRAPWR